MIVAVEQVIARFLGLAYAHNLQRRQVENHNDALIGFLFIQSPRETRWLCNIRIRHDGWATAKSGKGFGSSGVREPTPEGRKGPAVCRRPKVNLPTLVAASLFTFFAGKGGKNRRKGKNDSDADKRELVFKEFGQGIFQIKACDQWVGIGLTAGSGVENPYVKNLKMYGFDPTLPPLQL